MTPVNANSGEYKSRIGVKDLYVAEVTQDDASAYLADTPEYMAPVATVAQKPSATAETQYADDAAYDVMTAEGETEISMDVTGLPVEMLAKITGRTFDAASGRMFDHAATPPFMALMFRSKKSNGSYRYYAFLKGKFVMPEEEAETDGDKPNPKTTKLVFKAVHSTYLFDVDGSNSYPVKRVIGDDDTTNFDATGWFTAVQTPDFSAASALALSSIVPADEATGIAVTASVVMTFNNAMVNDAVNNITLLDESMAPVAAAVSLNAAKTVATLDPTASLTASHSYTVVISGVKDVYGQTLTTTKTFTTAA